MSRRSAAAAATTEPAGVDAIAAASESLQLAEGNSYCCASSETPLQRSIVVSIRSSLDRLCKNSSAATWSPSAESLKSMLQQQKFTSLEGSAEPQGDLKSIVLHELSTDNVVSTFPLAVGAKITGVDDNTYSSIGEAFSMVALPNTNSSIKKNLQSDDVSLAYEFAKKFPGYTSDNLAEKGVHEVAQRRFVLVAADHPIVSAISENADKLQMGEITMMPEGLVKISQALYDSILPLVQSQVSSQIKVRDLSRATVSIAPADFRSWDEARAELIAEAKRPLKAQLVSELAGAVDEAAQAEIKAGFAAKEAALEHDIDHKPFEFHASLAMSYNFLSK